MDKKHRLDKADVQSWLKSYDLRSKRQGWMITNNSANEYCIARLDDPQAWRDDGWPLNFSEPKFDCDEAAIEFVKGRQDDDEMYYRKAIDIHNAGIAKYDSSPKK